MFPLPEVTSILGTGAADLNAHRPNSGVGRGDPAGNVNG